MTHRSQSNLLSESNLRSLTNSAGLRLAAGLAALLPAGAGGQSAEERELDLGAGVAMRLVLIPAGAFTMGSTDAELEAVAPKWYRYKREEWFTHERPAREVTLSRAFWMGKHEVTVGQFHRFIDATGYRTDAEEGREFTGAFLYADAEVRRAADASWHRPYLEQTDAHPVVCVSWDDARALTEWLNALDVAKPPGMVYRLPTEAEWEYACRGGTSTVYHCGDSSNDLGDYAWWSGNSKGSTQAAGLKRPNAFGLHDMHGNAREWCLDWDQPYPDVDRADPPGPDTGKTRVVRGGSWYADSRALRSANRSSQLPAWRNNITGFRVVLAPPPRHPNRSNRTLAEERTSNPPNPPHPPHPTHHP